ncbi:MAG: ATP synthase F1 subunit delta [Bdellovibrionales bacterium]|nr:ATP synthase F1 subunit delta [Bdellovibrionales bacterium]
MSVAQSYAKALYEASRDQGVKAETIEAAVYTVASAIEGSKQLRDVLYSPSTSGSDRSKVLVALAEKAVTGKEGKLVGQFLTLLMKKRRLTVLSDIAGAFKKARVEAEGGVLGVVASADALKQDDLESLARAFTGKLGKKVVFETKIDAELLAGMKVTVGGVTYDGTLKNQLSRLRTNLIHGGSTSH